MKVVIITDLFNLKIDEVKELHENVAQTLIKKGYAKEFNENSEIEIKEVKTKSKNKKNEKVI